MPKSYTWRCEMVLLLILLVILVLVGVGGGIFVAHILWWVLIAALVVAVIGALSRR